MITDKQADARRRNGGLSTGPKTPAGRAVSSMNAVKFAFFARDPASVLALPGEDPAAFEEFSKGIVRELAPQGLVEDALARRVANALWQLRRMPAAQAAAVTAQMWESVGEQSRLEAIRLKRWEPINPAEAEDPEACQAMLDRERHALAQAAAPELALGRAYMRDAEGPKALALLCRYETAFERSLLRSLKALDERKKSGTEPDKARALTAKLRNEPTEDLSADPRAA